MLPTLDLFGRTVPFTRATARTVSRELPERTDSEEDPLWAWLCTWLICFAVGLEDLLGLIVDIFFGEWLGSEGAITELVTTLVDDSSFPLDGRDFEGDPVFFDSLWAFFSLTTSTLVNSPFVLRTASFFGLSFPPFFTF